MPDVVKENIVFLKFWFNCTHACVCAGWQWKIHDYIKVQSKKFEGSKTWRDSRELTGLDPFSAFSTLRRRGGDFIKTYLPIKFEAMRSSFTLNSCEVKENTQKPCSLSLTGTISKINNNYFQSWFLVMYNFYFCINSYFRLHYSLCYLQRSLLSIYHLFQD